MMAPTNCDTEFGTACSAGSRCIGQLCLPDIGIPSALPGAHEGGFGASGNGGERQTIR